MSYFCQASLGVRGTERVAKVICAMYRDKWLLLRSYSPDELFRCTIDQFAPLLRAHMTKSRSQELSEKADAERRRCRDWLLPFMQNNQPKFLQPLS